MTEDSLPSRNFRSDFLRKMQERGLIRQCTDFDALDGTLADSQITAYVGFDATATSLHVGHLMSLIAMRHLAATGHRIIALMGGGTTMLGDPSFRNSTRPMLHESDIDRNIEGIRANIEAVLGDHSDRLTVVNNKDWLGPVGFLEFMRNVGVHFSVSKMLSMESVKSRLEGEQSLSMMEFSYMMLQSADFVELSNRHDCVLQMGGSDQWGNIVNGIELGRRTGSKALFGLTTPLLTTANGEKMGKTAGGAVWLDRDLTSPFDFWQFWRNVADADLKRFLAIFSEMPIEEIEAIDETDVIAMNAAKKHLADAATTLVHGRLDAMEARRKSEMMFEGVITEVTHTVSLSDIRDIPTLLQKIGFAKSKSEGRRFIEGYAVRIDDELISDPFAALGKVGGQQVLVSVGKKKRALVEIAA